MNIEDNVKQYPDKHCVKMIIEYAQMLSTANRLLGLDEGYMATHINHPCCIWTRASLDNWIYLRELSRVLNEEWQFRFNHSYNHLSYDVIRWLSVPSLKSVGLTEPPLCMPDYCKVDGVVASYRNYFKNEKRHIAQWSKRPIPFWYGE